ncbi:MAG TPA: hypothetical protein VFP66_14865 [Candidatus Limnocylindrales bacterium]|nr:hypothetical protein [Candidatus Limnocylindrales bacterium]
MVDLSRGWLIFRADLTPDWDAFHAYWYARRAEAERESRQAGIEAFEAQRAAAKVLLEAAWAEQAHVRAVRKAEVRAERREASIERRRDYNAAWMRDYRARKKAERLALEQTADSRPLRTPPDVPGDRDL